MESIKNIIISIGMLCSFWVPTVNGAKPLETVTHVDLDRYLGKWYEIARYEAPFQQGCVASQAQYSLNSDGTIKVVNECRDKTLDGKLRRAEGKAWVVDSVSQAKLKVQFFWPFRGDYWVIDLGKDYEYSVVSEPKRRFLWILSRKPKMNETVLNEIKERLSHNEFDLSKLKMTLQPETQENH